MVAKKYILQALQYATITLVLAMITIVSARLLQGKNTALTGRLVSLQEQGIIPTLNISREQVTQGFTSPDNTHVIFAIPSGVRIPRITFFGGRDIDQTVRYWGYCFSGNEQANIDAGLTGSKIYDGQFFYSLAERKAQSERPKASDRNLLGILSDATAPKKAAPASIAEIFYGDHLCYVMTEKSLPSGLDLDGDHLNALRELTVGTNANIPDTDRDGIPDGDEVFVTKTDPRRIDTDDDGLSDSCEDKNKNGNLDDKETSPIAADTDRDDLCDGSGFAAGCPEPKRPYCYTNPEGKRECQNRPVGPAYGEDMNGNCQVDAGETNPRNAMTFGIADWYYKMNKFQKAATGGSTFTPTPTFPTQGAQSSLSSSLYFPIPLDGSELETEDPFPIPLTGSDTDA